MNCEAVCIVQRHQQSEVDCNWSTVDLMRYDMLFAFSDDKIRQTQLSIDSEVVLPSVLLCA